MEAERFDQRLASKASILTCMNGPFERIILFMLRYFLFVALGSGLVIHTDIFFFLWQPANGEHDKQVISVVDVAYGGENGFNQAIEQSSEVLGNVKFIQEKKVIQKYFDEISQVRIKPISIFEDYLCVPSSGLSSRKVIQKELLAQCKFGSS